MSEIRFSHPNLTPDDFQVSYAGGFVRVSIPKLAVVWAGTPAEASDILRGLIDKWATADVHELLLKGVLKK